MAKETRGAIRLALAQSEWLAFLLHPEDTFPTARQVTKRLSDPHAIRIKERLEAWRLTLEEVEYPVEM